MKFRHQISHIHQTFCRYFFVGRYRNPLPVSEKPHNNWILDLITGTALASSLLFPLSALAADLIRGKALYENHCRYCHEDWAHTRTKRKAISLANLRERVVGWNAHAGLDWGHEEVDDVVYYLNEKFYHFE